MIIAVDFDGTCVKHKYPQIGESIGAERVLKEIVKNGHQLVLCTMRGHKTHEGRDLLQEAVEWFEKNGIELYGVNETPFQHTWTDSNKPYAHLYIDDAALGCPKTWDNEGNTYVNWDTVERILIRSGVIDPELPWNQETIQEI